MLEQHRQGRSRPEITEAKVREVAQLDRELRGLECALREGQPLRELREAGVGGACADCGTVHGSSDRFCSWCGRRL